MYKLFVFLRSDLASMTPGKAAAQVAHAASQAAYVNMTPTGLSSAYNSWAKSAQECKEPKKYPDDHYAGFGTTIVLDAGTGEQLDKTFGNIVRMMNTNFCGMIVDPTYPVRDGSVTHAVDIPTCAWLLYDSGDTDIDLILKDHNYYNGNHA